MRTLKLFCLVTFLFLSQGMLWAQAEKETGRKDFQEAVCRQMVEALALDDETAAKFIPVYKAYLEELRACRGPKMRPEGRKPGEKKELTDEEVEKRILNSFAQMRKILDVKEKYYQEFRKILSPKQIQKIYNRERMNGARLQHEKERRGMERPMPGERRRPMGGPEEGDPMPER